MSLIYAIRSLQIKGVVSAVIVMRRVSAPAWAMRYAIGIEVMSVIHAIR